MDRLPIIALTPGEPAGIGPSLCVLLAQQNIDCQLVIIADSGLLEQRARELGLPLALQHWDSEAPVSKGIRVLPVNTPQPVISGRLNPDNATYVIQTIKTAAEGCLNHHFDAMVTGPVHKGVINEAGIGFTGHTELLANYCHVPQVVMMLVTDRLRVALATTHIPLAKVSGALTRDRLMQTIAILNQELQQQFHIKHPEILVCGLNPHAGEGGHLGQEEREIIEPVIQKLVDKGLHISGPIPADSAFIPSRLEHADAVLAMYHDQGLPVLKHAGFGEAVNITLGLPFIRTSVDHGTALDRTLDKTVDIGSLRKAIDMAQQMVAA